MTASSRRLRELVVTLDGYAGPENVGILMAEKRDYFEDAGLKVTIHSPIGPLRPVPYVVEDLANLSISHQPQIVVAKDKSVPIVAVGSVLPESTAAMIWLKGSGIGEIADLKGKTIAIPGFGFQKRFLKTILERAGLTLADVQVKTVEYKLVPALLSGRAEAIFGGSWNLEGIELEEQGAEPVITKVQDLGVPPYEELVMIVRRSRLAKDPQSIRDFLSAVAKGTEAAIDDPAAAAKAIEEVGERNPEYNRKAVAAEVEATLPLLSRDGYMDPDQARGLADWMHEQGLIQRTPPVSSLLTNRFVR